MNSLSLGESTLHNLLRKCSGRILKNEVDRLAKDSMKDMGIKMINTLIHNRHLKDLRLKLKKSIEPVLNINKR